MSSAQHKDTLYKYSLKSRLNGLEKLTLSRWALTKRLAEHVAAFLTEICFTRQNAVILEFHQCSKLFYTVVLIPLRDICALQYCECESDVHIRKVGFEARRACSSGGL